MSEEKEKSKETEEKRTMADIFKESATVVSNNKFEFIISLIIISWVLTILMTFVVGIDWSELLFEFGSRLRITMFYIALFCGSFIIAWIYIYKRYNKEDKK